MTTSRCYGLFVEHYQKYEVIWNGNGGETYFYQNEMPYDPPNQAAWMNGSLRATPRTRWPTTVTTHEAYGLGSYCDFTQPGDRERPRLRSAEQPGIKFLDLVTVSLGGEGTIEHVINTTGGATPSNTTPVDVTTYP